jgi:hypothetical protein
MSGILSANPAVRRREEALAERARMDRIDSLLDRVVEGAKAPSTPSFSDSVVEEVGKLLVEGRLRLPSHVRVTVTTEVSEVKSKIFGDTQLITHTADQLHSKLLRPLTVREALEAGLIAQIASGWVWSEGAYQRLSKNQ